MSRFEDSHDLFGAALFQNTWAEIQCDVCGTTYPSEEHLEPLERSAHGHRYTEFAGLVVVSCCFEAIEREIWNRIDAILPWVQRRSRAHGPRGGRPGAPGDVHGGVLLRREEGDPEARELMTKQTMTKQHLALFAFVRRRLAQEGRLSPSDIEELNGILDDAGALEPPRVSGLDKTAAGRIIGQLETARAILQPRRRAVVEEPLEELRQENDTLRARIRELEAKGPYR